MHLSCAARLIIALFCGIVAIKAMEMIYQIDRANARRPIAAIVTIMPNRIPNPRPI